ncbi:stabilin-2-like isoform X1 [Branchiostoma floridae x Branchiostoma belcheri]
MFLAGFARAVLTVWLACVCGARSSDAREQETVPPAAPTASSPRPSRFGSRCDVTATVTATTACRTCPLNAEVECPKGTTKTTQGEGLRDCQYRIPVFGSWGIVLTGCHHVCARQVLQPQCCPGYWGPDCQECPGGADNPCSGHGACAGGIQGNGTCTCEGGFGGIACETCKNDKLYGPECSGECTCVHGICKSGLEGDGSCTCLSGYKGEHCDEPLPHCDALDCNQFGRCVEQAQGEELVCRCLPGYHGDGKNSCLPIDPCLEAVCAPQADCIHTGPNQHRCECRPNYSGDGRVCLPIDPCQTNFGGCPTNSTVCVYDAPGKAHCECKQGYVDLVEGQGCGLIDICQHDNPCHRNANCTTVAPGQTECVCKLGYVGDGINCYGNILERISELNNEDGGPLRGHLVYSSILLQSAYARTLTRNGPFTVFVPNDAAFQNKFDVVRLVSDLPKAQHLAKLHILPGHLTAHQLNTTNSVFNLEGAGMEIEPNKHDTFLRVRLLGTNVKSKMVFPDIVAANGLIHVIDTVLDMDSVVPSMPEATIKELIEVEGKYNRMEGLLKLVGMAEMLEEPGPFTVFAPNNGAWDSLPQGTLDYLMSEEGKPKLKAILKNHIIVNNKIEVQDLIFMPRFTTLENMAITVSVTAQGAIKLDGSARVYQTDIAASNGYVHSVDKVLIPDAIKPLFNHRCDVMSYDVVAGSCSSCSQIDLNGCPEGAEPLEIVERGCVFWTLIWNIRFPHTGCSRKCNQTVMLPECCEGFYGESCLPCPGGYRTPCNLHGQCNGGINGNGTCVCDPGFMGTTCEICQDKLLYGVNCDKECDCLHGECNGGPNGDGTCKPNTCEQGWTGENCDQPINPCGPNLDVCHEHAQCDNQFGNIRCVCKSGYTGSGLECIEMNPCRLPDRGGCHPDATCIKVGPGTNVCQCDEGWEGDGISCIPVDNCRSLNRGGCDPHADCIFTAPGQNDCRCMRGFRGDGKTCTPINPCLENFGGCHSQAVCTQTGPGTNNCTCVDGYIGDGRRCYGTLLVELTGRPELSTFSNLIAIAGLQNLFSGPVMKTVFAFTDDAFLKLSEEDKSRWWEVDNIPFLIKYHTANSSLTFDNLTQYYLDQSQPLPTLLLGTMLSLTQDDGYLLVGGAKIIGNESLASNGIIHQIDQVLLPPESVLPTLAPPRPPLSELMEGLTDYSLFAHYLSEDGLLEQLETVGPYTLFAPNNAAVLAFTRNGSDPRAISHSILRYHIVTGLVLTSDRIINGQHFATSLGHNYQIGFAHSGNKLLVNREPVVSPDMLTRGGVVHGMGTVLRVRRNRCDSNITTTIQGNCYSCQYPPVCPPGTKPLKRPRVSNCIYVHIVFGVARRSLGCSATCVRTTFSRQCCSGYYGMQCAACPGPVDDPCYGNGECVDGLEGTGECKCQPNFGGTACENCIPGRYGEDCGQVCTCVNGTCNEGVKGDGSCTCNVGWRGPHCDEAVTGDQCAGTCHSSANCVGSGDYARCICAAGFTGTGQQCSVINPCEVSNGGCSEHAQCMRTTPGNRKCTCLDGYTGDGVICLEIDPCQSDNGDCHENAVCLHTGPNMRVCHCQSGYEGDGERSCRAVNPCTTNNGGCSSFAVCNHTGPNERECICQDNYIGDGITCTGNIGQELGLNPNTSLFYSLLQSTNSHQLVGAGPFTVFAPTNRAFMRLQQDVPGQVLKWRRNGMLHQVLQYHMIGCVQLMSHTMEKQDSLRTLQGDLIKLSLTQTGLLLNGDTHINRLDHETSNGVIHYIDSVLTPSNMQSFEDLVNTSYVAPRDNTWDDQETDQWTRTDLVANITVVATSFKYNLFLGALQTAGLVSLVSDPVHTPITMFWPTDHALKSMPDRKYQELLKPKNRGELIEYLKYHIIRDARLSATALVTSNDLRTLQGSMVEVMCKGEKGDLYVNEDSKIVQRGIMFEGGVAYGIDNVLEPPSIGGRCDVMSNRTFTGECGPCRTDNICPDGSRPVGPVQRCVYMAYYRQANGCKRQCVYTTLKPKCCPNYYGRDCRACPGGAQRPCNGHGTCDDGVDNHGHCRCNLGYRGQACELCDPGRFGPNCEPCFCSNRGLCRDGIENDGACFCEEGWTGPRCSRRLDSMPTCDPPCDQNAVCREDNMCQCLPNFQGNGRRCSAIDLCALNNGGCHLRARCRQVGTNTTCQCEKGYEGDGYVCRGIDRCAVNNGGCHSNATCRYTGPNTRTCTCKPGFTGDGEQCKLPRTTIGKCDINNGGCSPNGRCVEIRPSARKPAGDVQCSCMKSFVGNGTMCNSEVYQTLQFTPQFSRFYIEVQLFERRSSEGRKLRRILEQSKLKLTLFVPSNDGLPVNVSLSDKDIKNHLLMSKSFVRYEDFKDGMVLKTKADMELVVTADFKKGVYMVNGQEVLEWNIPTTNGIIHIIKGPLFALRAPKASGQIRDVGPTVTSGTIAGIIIALLLVVVLCMVAACFFVKRHKRSPVLGKYKKTDDGGSVTFDNLNNCKEDTEFDTFENPTYSKLCNLEEEEKLMRQQDGYDSVTTA